MNEPAASEGRAHEYRLFVREGPARFYFKNNDEGVWLSERGVGWYIGGVSHTRKWSELSTVHLQVGYVYRQGSFGSAALHFSDGAVVTVLSASKWGAADPERNPEYGRFLTDLHRMIPETERGRVRFQCGASEARHMVLMIVVIFAGILFGLLPLGILIYFRTLEALFVAGAGVAFIWPLFRMVKTSEPSTYDPNAVPEDFYP
jgi:hypothetical protein